ncbi:unnamed protein product [Brachionus calyciflorus]|uniref:BED-type domain-containing protein n=1 Tax=Brachionus calyciflorus TaxID=104777 RepID=A0A813RDL8_9BILA|nr:unnamed protein product [Brachionus calyciflorus]
MNKSLSSKRKPSGHLYKISLNSSGEPSSSSSQVQTEVPTPVQTYSENSQNSQQEQSTNSQENEKKYFEKTTVVDKANIEVEMLQCIECKKSNIIKYYHLSTGKSNLDYHLETVHDIKISKKTRKAIVIESLDQEKLDRKESLRMKNWMESFSEQSSPNAEQNQSSTRKRKYRCRSTIWQHATKVKIDNVLRIKCNYCSVNYSHYGSTTNMSSHLRKHHIEKLDGQEIDEQEAEIEDYEDEFKTEQIDVSLNQNKARLVVSNSQIELNLLKFFISSSLPFEMVENLQFKIFIESLNSNYDLPNKYELIKRILNFEYENTLSRIQNELASAEFISISYDFWSSNQSLSYLDITAHFIDSDFNRKSHLISVKNIPDDNKSEEIAKIMSKISEKWKISDKIFSIISNNWDEMKENSEFIQFPCAANLLNLIIKEIKKLTTDSVIKEDFLLPEEKENLKSYVEIVQKCRGIASTYSHCQIFVDKLKLAQNSFNIKNNCLTKDTPNKWNTTYIMLERILEQSAAINEALDSLELNGKYSNLKLCEKEIEFLEEIINVFSCLSEAIGFLSECKHVSLGIILPLFETLKVQLTYDESDGLLTKCLKKFVFFWTDFYTEKFKIFDNEYFMAASFFDVRTKNFTRFSESKRKNFLSTAKNTIKKIYSELSDDLKNHLISLSKKVHDDKVFKSPNDKNKSKLQCFDFFDSDYVTPRDMKNWDQVDRELFKYEQEASKNVDPYNYWKINNETFPILSYISKYLFCIPASSYPGRFVFSDDDDNIWERRNIYGADVIEKVMIIYDSLN